MQFVLSLLLFAALLLTGCGKQVAPDYNDARSQVLLDAIEAIVSNNDDKALDALKRMDQLQGPSDFTDETRLAVKHRQTHKTACDTLASLDTDELKAFLAKKAARGEAGTELLSLEGLPDALQALALFCARMPWEDSKVLSKELARLEPHTPILSQSPVFKAFLEEQVATLKRLKEFERQRQARQFLADIAQAALSGDRNALALHQGDFGRAQPGHPFFGYVKGGVTPARPDEFYAIAVLLNWTRLSPAERKAAWTLLAPQKNALGLSGLALEALATRRPQAYEALFRAAAFKVSLDPRFARDYAALSLPRFSARVFPGLGEAAAVFQTGAKSN